MIQKFLPKYVIPYKTGDIFRIKPWYDWHYGNKACDLNALRKYLADGADDPNCYAVGGGDLADSIVVPDYRYRKGMDGTETEAVIDEQIEGLYPLMEPYKGRILGFGVGNHEDTILKKCGTHLSRRLAKRFKTASLGYQWVVLLSFKNDKRGGRSKQLVLFGHHGWGGSNRTEGGSITKYARHALHFEAHIYIYGHDHKLDSNTVNFMGVRDGEYRPKDKHIFFPGTFKRTFSATDEPTWEETMGFNPVTLKGMDICIQPTEDWFKIWSSTN